MSENDVSYENKTYADRAPEQEECAAKEPKGRRERGDRAKERGQHERSVERCCSPKQVRACAHLSESCVDVSSEVLTRAPTQRADHHARLHR
jgi:hypothetical protein